MENIFPNKCTKVARSGIVYWQVSWFWGWAYGVPGISLAHRSLAKRKHYLFLHLVNVLLQVRVVLLVLFLTSFVDEHPATND